jgi:phosphoribosyl 1,2-cyclic phosphate phosphodiesterase
LDEIEVTPLEVIHGKLPVVAYRFNDFAYATDLKVIPRDSMDGLRDLECALSSIVCAETAFDPSSPGRSIGIESPTSNRIARYLTHLNHDILYERDSKLLPDNVELAFDETVVMRMRATEKTVILVDCSVKEPLFSLPL